MSDTLYFVMQQMLTFAVPLMIAALAAMWSEKSGVINIAVEGIMVMGAFAGTMYLHFAMEKEGFNPNGALLVAILLSALVGMAFSALHAFASINMFADQTISGTALNMFSTAFCIYVARSILGMQSVAFLADYMIQEVPVLGKIPLIGPIFFQDAYITTYVGILILLLSIFVMKKTRFGLRLRSAGEFPQATDAAGVSVPKIRWAGVLISGAVAGIAGLAYIVPISSEFNGSVSGYGFLAMAVLIFGQWNPGKIALASLFFGLLKALSAVYSGIPFLLALNIPQVIYLILPYVVTILVLVIPSDESHAPAASGQPFDKGKR